MDELGLTEKEYKAFKKSGGIKRIKNILKEYKKNPYNATNIYPLPSGLAVESFEQTQQKSPQEQNSEKQQKLDEHEQEIDDIYSQVVAKFDDQQEK